MQRLSPDQQQKFYDALLRERHFADVQIAQNMQQLAHGERSVIFYGADHGAYFEGTLGSQNMSRHSLTSPHTRPEALSRYSQNQGWRQLPIPSAEQTAPLNSHPASRSLPSPPRFSAPSQ